MKRVIHFTRAEMEEQIKSKKFKAMKEKIEDENAEDEGELNIFSFFLLKLSLQQETDDQISIFRILLTYRHSIIL
jgi:hypothetical protein